MARQRPCSAEDAIAQGGGLVVDAVLDQRLDEGWPGVAVMALDFADAVQCFGIDLAIDTGDIDIDDPHRHSGEPFAAVAADFLLQAAFARQDGEGRPGVGVAKAGVCVHARLTDAAGDGIDHLATFLPLA